MKEVFNPSRKSIILELERIIVSWGRRVDMHFTLEEYKNNKEYQITNIGHLRCRLKNSQKIGIPANKGVYIVLRDQHFIPEFILEGTGGFFKRLNPNIDIKALSDNWISYSHILYIGKAGGVSSNGTLYKATLDERIAAYIKFGMGKNVSHWGGRYIWQIKNSDKLFIAYKECNEHNPVEIESQMLRAYYEKYKRLPFANLRF